MMNYMSKVMIFIELSKADSSPKGPVRFTSFEPYWGGQHDTV